MISGITSKRQYQSCYAEPAKRDIPCRNFKQFFYKRYNVQLLDFLNKYCDSLEIPDGFVWDPCKVDQHKANDRYMRLEYVLLAAFIIHFHYCKKYKFSIFDIIKNMLCFNQCSFANGIKLKYPITARVIKYCKIVNGGSNAVKVAVGDFGFTKPQWFNLKDGKMYNCNKYGRITGVKLIVLMSMSLTIEQLNPKFVFNS